MNTYFRGVRRDGLTVHSDKDFPESMGHSFIIPDFRPDIRASCPELIARLLGHTMSMGRHRPIPDEFRRVFVEEQTAPCLQDTLAR